MDVELINRYLLDWQERPLPNLKKRDIIVKESSRIQTVIGARRVGKTSLLNEKIKELLSAGVNREQVIYLHLEDPLLDGVTFKDFNKILEIHWSLFPKSVDKKMYLFLDEPQVVDNWESAVRGLRDEGNISLFMTGSSSKLFSKEIATSLRGRSHATVVYPLSFGEFCRFKGQSFDINRISTKEKALLIHSLDQYLSYGGYPEVVNEEDTNEKLVLLKDYYDLTIYKDIVDRYAIKNTSLIRWLINYAVSCVTKELSINKVFTTLKSTGQRLSRNTLYEYVSMLEDCFFLSIIKRHSFSAKNEALTIPKIYLNDVGFLSLFSDHDYGKRLENSVAIDLLRRKTLKPLMNISYWKSKEGKEVDFIVSEGGKVSQAIQVCCAINNSSTKERELSALKECMDDFGLKEGTIITRDHEEMLKTDKGIVHMVPFWKRLGFVKK
ncbi:MAG: ATP-binding protein [Endomicrobiales bacterium]|jgi:predicted AAA+ superfamily ATPase